VNDGGGSRRAELGAYDDAVGKPGEFGRDVTTSVALGNDETAIGRRPDVALLRIAPMHLWGSFEN
jgi:hypothetical protein